MTVRSPARLASNLYQGATVPKSGDEPVPRRIWLNGASAPPNGRPFEAAIESFWITP